MAAGATYEKIATSTLGSDTSSVTFSAISGSYTDIVAVLVIKGSTGNPYPIMELNSDTGNNYSTTYLTGTGTAAQSARTSNTIGYMVDYVTSDSTNFNWNGIYHFQNYSNSTTYKTVLSRVNRADRGTEAGVLLWRNTAAITSIKIRTNTANFATGSTFTLYGIKAA